MVDKERINYRNEKSWCMVIDVSFIWSEIPEQVQCIQSNSLVCIWILDDTLITPCDEKVNTWLFKANFFQETALHSSQPQKLYLEQ